MHSVGCAKQSIALLKAGITRILRGAMRPSCGPVAHKKQKTRLFFAEEEYQNSNSLGIRSCRFHHRLPYMCRLYHTESGPARKLRNFKNLGRTACPPVARKKQLPNRVGSCFASCAWESLTWCRRCGRRRRPGRERYSRGRSDGRPARQHRCPHPGGLPAFWQPPRERR